MKTTKRTTQAAVADLAERLPRAVRLQQQIEALSEEFKNEKAAIRAGLEDAELMRYAAPDGEEALLVDEERLTWNVDKLEKLLDESEFEGVCPRKPDAAALRGMLAACNEQTLKTLRACARASHTSRLELRAAEAKPEPVAAVAQPVEMTRDYPGRPS